MWAVEKLYQEGEAVGQVCYMLEMVEIPGVNHFYDISGTSDDEWPSTL